MTRLIDDKEPAGVAIERPTGRSPILLIADHAGNRVPAKLQNLGLAQAELDRHIGYDIGVLGVCRQISKALDSTLIYQPYSRLVVDCNRHPQYEAAFPDVSDGTPVPGNRTLEIGDIARRPIDIFMPYHAAIGSWLDHRTGSGAPVAIVAMHSFTPFHGDMPADRPWPVSLLYNHDDQIALKLVDALTAATGGPVGINQPYRVDDVSDYAIPVHGERRGIPSVEIEIRQDLIQTQEAQASWGRMLAPLIDRAVRAVLDGQ